MVEVYIDRRTKKILGGAVIPMWVQSPVRGNYRPLPIFDIINDPTLGKEVSTHDMERVDFIHRHITRVMLGAELDLNTVQEKYYHDADGFVRAKSAPIELTDAMMRGKFYRLLTTMKTVCFVGDSITEGTTNNGVPWYEPLEPLIDGRVINCGWGSCTTKILLKDHVNAIVASRADLFVIAIGTNDVRYRNATICSMTADEYIARLTDLRNAIVAQNPRATFCFITPWRSTDGDYNSRLSHRDRTKVYGEYDRALKTMCEENGDTFIDPTAYIEARLRLYPRSKYMLDAIHPNATEGVRLYSEAVMLS